MAAMTLLHMVEIWNYKTETHQSIWGRKLSKIGVSDQLSLNILDWFWPIFFRFGRHTGRDDWADYICDCSKDVAMETN